MNSRPAPALSAPLICLPASAATSLHYFTSSGSAFHWLWRVVILHQADFSEIIGLVVDLLIAPVLGN